MSATSSTRWRPATSTRALTHYTGELLPQSVSPGDRAAAYRAEREPARRGAVVGKPCAASSLARPARGPRRPGRLAGAARQRRAGPVMRAQARGHLAGLDSNWPSAVDGCNVVQPCCNRLKSTFSDVRHIYVAKADGAATGRHRQEKRHDRLCATGCRGLADDLPAPVRELHRRRVGRTRGRPLLREPQPGQRSAVLRDGPLRRNRHREGARRRARRRTGLGQDDGRRTGGDPQQDRRPHRGEPRIHRRRRIVGQRQADARDAQRRHPVGGGPFPVFRRCDPRAGGLAVPDRRRNRRLSLPRTARRGRPDHPVELPDPDGHLETGAGSRGRKRRRAQACRADPGVDPLPVLVDR